MIWACIGVFGFVLEGFARGAVRADAKRRGEEAVDAKGAVGGTPFRFAHFGHAIKNGPLSLAGETKGRLFECIGAI